MGVDDEKRVRGGGSRFDLGQRRSGIFFAEGLDTKSVICPSGKIIGRVGWVEPFAKPITVQKMMGIASAFALRATADKSLHPSCALRSARNDGFKASRRPLPRPVSCRAA